MASSSSEGFLYGAANNPSAPQNAFGNLVTNAPGSAYATAASTTSTGLIQRITKKLIFDAAPQQFFDLKLLAMKPFEQVSSDEFYFHEMGFGREPITLGAGGITGGAPTENGVVIGTGTEFISKDTILVLPDNSKVIVKDVPTTTTINIASIDGGNISAHIAGKVLSNLAPVEADGSDSISQYFRMDTEERYNYVQMLVKAMRFGRMELYKYENAGTTDNFLSMQKQRMLQQFRIDLSNTLWNGERAAVTTASGGKAKTTGGIFPSMVAAGSPSVSTTAANLDSAFESLVLDTEFKAYGATRFLYGTPRRIHDLTQLYKKAATRYAPSEDVARLQLTAIDMGSSKIVLVPMKRFEETSCFPTIWKDRMILLDQESVGVVQCWGEEMGETMDRRGGATLQNYKDFWVSTTFGVQFNNPLGSGYIDIT